MAAGADLAPLKSGECPQDARQRAVIGAEVFRYQGVVTKSVMIYLLRYAITAPRRRPQQLPDARLDPPLGAGPAHNGFYGISAALASNQLTSYAIRLTFPVHKSGAHRWK